MASSSPAPRESRPTVLQRSLHRSRSQSSVSTSEHEPTFPRSIAPKRAVSYPETTLHHRVRIQYQDEALRLRALANVKKLLQTAAMAEQSVSASPTNSEILARKALKYRKVFARMSEVDVHDPMFDASEFLGVEWCKHTPRTTRRYAIPTSA